MEVEKGEVGETGQRRKEEGREEKRQGLRSGNLSRVSEVDTAGRF